MASYTSYISYCKVGGSLQIKHDVPQTNSPDPSVHGTVALNCSSLSVSPTPQNIAVGALSCANYCFREYEWTYLYTQCGNNRNHEIKYLFHRSNLMCPYRSDCDRNSYTNRSQNRTNECGCNHKRDARDERNTHGFS